MINTFERMIKVPIKAVLIQVKHVWQRDQKVQGQVDTNIFIDVQLSFTQLSN